MDILSKQLNRFIGMNFQDWCRLDEDDDRRILYTLSGIIDGQYQTVEYTSDDEVDVLTMLRIRSSVIEDIQLIDDEWLVKLNY